MVATNNIDAPCMGGIPSQETWQPNTSMVQNPTWAELVAANKGATDYALAIAAQMMWTATGRKFNLCDIQLRPCDRAQLPTYLTFPSIWNPGAEGGQWAWGLVQGPGGSELIFGGCGCVAGSCRCTPPQVILLPPAYRMISVQVDGQMLDQGAYRLDGNLLVRTDGGTWPQSQDLAKDTSQVGTFVVRYLRGTPVPALLNSAAGFYAGEIAKSMTGATCQLPQRVQSITRQGVSVQLNPVADYLDKGLTGVPLVDQVIRMYNPTLLKQPPRVISLDMPTYR